MPRKNRRTMQQQNGELGLIVDQFGRAMWSADRKYVAETGRLTPNMEIAWEVFVEFCKNNLNEKTTHI